MLIRRTLCAVAVLSLACSSDGGKGGGTGGSNDGGASNQGGAGANAGGKGGSTSAAKGGTSSGGGVQVGGEAGAGEAGAAVAEGGSNAGSGGAGSDAGGAPEQDSCPSDSATEPVDFGSLCDPEMTLGSGSALAELGDGSQLVGVTPDELSVAWSAPKGSTLGFFVADRSDPLQPFGDRTEVSANLVALSPDGLRLIALSDDQGALLELSRAAVGAAFGEAEEGAFSLLDADARENGYGFLDAVVSADDRSLFFNVISAEAMGSALRVSKRVGGEPWPVGVPVEGCEFESHGSALRHPTALSSDGLTLFYYDTVRDRARAAFRPTPDDPFVHFIDLGARYQLTPNASCKRFHYWTSAETTRVVVADAD
ncbi:MAG: hypothetical protein QM756_15400 [Polyangiaceae bacterium]